jgi:hypothetical protein
MNTPFMHVLVMTSSIAAGWFAPFAPPAFAQAQTGAPALPVAPPPAAGGAAGGIFAVISLVGLLVLIGVAVKLHDARHRREIEGVALQTRLSDALMMDSRLSSMPIVASVHGRLRRPSSLVVEITGVVPSTELRDTAMDIVRREPAATGACIEDHIAVDPMRFQHAA